MTPSTFLRCTRQLAAQTANRGLAPFMNWSGLGHRLAWDLRWFTPTVEIDLCGHATFAAAHVLGGRNVFHTRGGALHSAALEPDRIDLELPEDPPTIMDLPESARVALGEPEVVGSGRGTYDLLVQVGSVEQVRGLRPDLDALGRLPYRGLIVTATEEGGSGVVCRCFYPAVGVPEDAASGSAQCTVGGWWFDRLGIDELDVRQLSTRGGAVRIARHDTFCF